LVAKILVADDNSNIQKMVGLALKDQGIDVVAVGNGEAAVRKISDVHPDLVLADVFMPVRNGYEVCQYVKGDSSLAHIPVILLVGAFDPLDEQEAQRVGADGVLKKPFVPPDPLISMVKSALARAGVAVGGAAPTAAPKEEPIHAAEMLTPRTQSETSAFAPVEVFPSVESEPLVETTPAKPEPVRIDSNAQPLAFGSLLETPATDEAPEEEAAYATTARPELERDWHTGDEEEDEVEEEEEEKAGAGWRRDGGNESIESDEEPSGPVKDWRETAFTEASARKSRSEHWTPQKESSSTEEAAEAEQSVGTFVTEAPVAATKVTPAPVAPFPEDAWASALAQKTAVQAATIEAPAPPKEEMVAETKAEEPVSVPVSATPAPEPAKRGETPWYSAVASPWDAEVEKANQLASTWDSPATSTPAPSAVPETVPAAKPEPVAAQKEDPSATVDYLPASLSEEVKTKVEEAALPASTVEAIREETQQVTDTVILRQAPAAKTAEPAKAAPPSVEDLVAKVLAQMSPDVLQAVTREILKPVVEAMVREEINTKK
jgi:CheY-like chemotaxis protein